MHFAYVCDSGGPFDISLKSTSVEIGGKLKKWFFLITTHIYHALLSVLKLFKQPFCEEGRARFKKKGIYIWLWILLFETYILRHYTFNFFSSPTNLKEEENGNTVRYVISIGKTPFQGKNILLDIKIIIIKIKRLLQFNQITGKSKKDKSDSQNRSSWRCCLESREHFFIIRRLN